MTTYLTNYNATKNIDCIAKINTLDIPKHQGGRYSLSGFIGLDMTSDSLLVNMHSNNGDLINRYVRFTPKYDWLGRIQTLAIDTLFKSPQEAGTLLNDYAEFINLKKKRMSIARVDTGLYLLHLGAASYFCTSTD